MDDIKAELNASAQGIEPFSLSVEGVGGFPNLKTPRVVWVGVNRNEALYKLQKNIEERLSKIGFEKEVKPFHPHLTLCRIRTIGDSKELGKAVTELNPEINLDFKVNSFRLYKSVLSPKGAEYTVLNEIFLGNKAD